MVKAAMQALAELRLPEDIATLRGKSLEEIRG
jgi:ribosomal protein S5